MLHCYFRFKEDDEAVLMANDTEYGLAAYFYTRDLRRAWTIAEQLEYGMVRRQQQQQCSWDDA
jgi:succinate-semialdehyde dehydrogenase/glutarate-semialdehyde dehydrogenase